MHWMDAAFVTAWPIGTTGVLVSLSGNMQERRPPKEQLQRHIRCRCDRRHPPDHLVLLPTLLGTSHDYYQSATGNRCGSLSVVGCLHHVVRRLARRPFRSGYAIRTRRDGAWRVVLLRGAEQGEAFLRGSVTASVSRSREPGEKPGRSRHCKRVAARRHCRKSVVSRRAQGINPRVRILQAIRVITNLAKR